MSLLRGSQDALLLQHVQQWFNFGTGTFHHLKSHSYDWATKMLASLKFHTSSTLSTTVFFFLSEPHQIASKFYENNDLLQRSCQPIIQNKPFRTFQISWAAGLYNLLLIWWPADTALVYLVFPCSCWGTNNPNMYKGVKLQSWFTLFHFSSTRTLGLTQDQ